MKMIKGILSLLIAGVLCGVSLVKAQQLPYQNPSLPVEERVNDLLLRMTLNEKIAQIRHLHSWDVFDGQDLNDKKLDKMCSGVGKTGSHIFAYGSKKCRGDTSR